MLSIDSSMMCFQTRGYFEDCQRTYSDVRFSCPNVSTISPALLGLFHDSQRATETAWGQPCVQLRSCTGPLMFSI